MYKKTATGWLKHLDFIIIDVIALQMAYVLAYLIRMGSLELYTVPFYRNLDIIISLWDILVAILFNTMHNVMKRGFGRELSATLRQSFLVFAGGTVILFSFQLGESYSRIILFLTLLFHICFGYLTRLLWKLVLGSFGPVNAEQHTMLAVLRAGSAEEMLTRLSRTSRLDAKEIVGVVLDQDVRTAAAYGITTDPLTGKIMIAGVPVVCSLEEASHFICREYIDSVYIDVSVTNPLIHKLMDDCHQMAVPVHYHVPGMRKNGAQQFVEKIGGTVVLTTTINTISPAKAIAKRLLDIIGGALGSLAALVVIAILGPIIKRQSPGPILYKQERIGRNGKRFRMVKLRSMYVDADARKAELMKENRVKDGMMFKLDWDPRVIGNEILPDGTRKTGIGDFIRRTSLDEFPQFFNVLKGDMSLVGTRPPTVNEWEQYEFHHRARLSCKPGITGLWQVSGRSQITDFNEVVRLDTEYISNWSFWLDVKILLKTVVVVLKNDGAM